MTAHGIPMCPCGVITCLGCEEDDVARSRGAIVEIDIVREPLDPARKTFGLGLCSTGKYRYDTRHAADRATRELHRRRRSGESQRGVAVYRCDVCHGWHLGRSFASGRSR